MKRKRVFGAVFMAVVLLLAAFPVYKVNADNTGRINVSDFCIKLNDSELEEGTTVKDDDRLAITFNWSIGNTDSKTNTFVIDLAAMTKKIEIEDVQKKDVLNSDDETIGKFYISGGKMYIILNDDYVGNGSEKKGGANIVGIVKTGLKEEDNGRTIPIGIGDLEYNVIYDAAIKDSELTIKKTASGSVQRTGNELRQAYDVELTAKNGEVTGVSLEDKSDNGLSDISEITVKESTVTGIVQGGVYNSLESLNSALSGVKFNKNDKLVISYTMKVDKDIATDNPSRSYTNKVIAGYTDNKGIKDSHEATARIDYEKPVVEKKAEWKDRDTGIVKWTIKVKLNSYNDPEKSSLSDYNASILDEVSGDWNDGEFNGNFDPSKFIYNSETGEYTYTYEMKIKDSYLNSQKSANLTNNVKISFNWDGNITNISGTGTVFVDARNWVSKKAVGYDYDKHDISWKITLNPVPEKIKDLIVTDTTPKWDSSEGTHKLTGSVYIEDESGKKVQVADDNGHLIEENGIINSYSDGQLKFDDTYIASQSGKCINIYYKSHIEDEDKSIDGRNYRNRVDIQYSQDGRIKTSDAGAFFRKSEAVTKKYERVPLKNQIRYTVKADLSKVENLHSGQKLVFTDTLPNGMKLIDGSVSAVAYNGSDKIKDVNVTTDNNGGSLVFTVKITDDMLSEDISNLSVDVYYTLGVKNEKDFVLAGQEKTFENYVRGSVDDNIIGESTTTTILKPQRVISKNAVYSKDTAPYAEYEIRVNPDSVDLSNGTLVARDELGEALSYDLDSIKVEKYDNWNWVELKRGSEYSYTLDSDKNSLTFNLPDGTYLRIKYRARVNLYVSIDTSKNATLTEKNSYNRISLEGFKEEVTKSAKSFTCVAITPHVWGDAEFGRINILKYWNENGNLASLSGCSFKLEKCHYDSKTGKMVTDEVVNQDIPVDENGKASVGNLLYDQIYSLVETKAPNGFKIRTEPYYFVITGSDGITLPEDIAIKEFGNGAVLTYENTLAGPSDDNQDRQNSGHNGNIPDNGQNTQDTGSGQNTVISNEEDAHSTDQNVSTSDKSNINKWAVVCIVSVCLIIAIAAAGIVKNKKFNKDRENKEDNK